MQSELSAEIKKSPVYREYFPEIFQQPCSAAEYPPVFLADRARTGSVCFLLYELGNDIDH